MGSGNLGMVVVLYYGGNYVNQGLISVGDLSTMLLYSVYAGFSTSALLSYYGDLMKAAGSAERIFDLMDTDHNRTTAAAAATSLMMMKKKLDRREEKNKGQQQQQQQAIGAPASTLPPVKGPIVFKDLQFAYPTRKEFPVFQGLDLEVKENETLALVGPSGSGKSSIAALLTRMYEPDGGEIYLGERVPLREIPKQHLRKQISYVTQDAVLFSGSVRENLFLGFSDLEEGSVKVSHIRSQKGPSENEAYSILCMHLSHLPVPTSWLYM